MNNAADALSDLSKEISEAMSGRGNSFDTKEQDMMSGNKASQNQGLQQALKELADEIGAGDLDGDVNIRCDNVPNNPYSNETPKETEQRMKHCLERAVIEDKRSGNTIGSMPSWMKAEIEGILHPPISATSRIVKFMGKFGPKNHRSFKVANRRNTFFKNHMVRPGVRKNTAVCYVLMDTSGSMFNGEDAQLLRTAMGMVDRLAVQNQMDVKIIQADTEVKRVITKEEAIKMIDEGKFEVVGCGGSNFNSAFEMIWKEIVEEHGNRGNPIVVFTDGAIYVPESVPKGVNQQTVWFTRPGQRAPTDKWGEHIELNF